MKYHSMIGLVKVICLILCLFLLRCKSLNIKADWKKTATDFTELKANFTNPPQWFAPHAFWFWDDTLDSDRISEMAEQLSIVGLNPGYVHPRKGLPKDEWLSPKWFQSYGQALEQAESYNTSIGFCDEYWWPAWQANGKVLEKFPELKATSLKWEAYELVGPESIVLPASEFTVACQVDNEGLILSESLSIIGTGPSFSWEAPRGNWKIFSYEKYFHEGIDGGKVNYLDPRLATAFQNIAHKPYTDNFPQQMGKTLSGVFCDHEGDYGWKLAWSDYLPQKYEQITGKDIRLFMPLLTHQDHEGYFAKARYDWFNVISDIYVNDIIKPSNDWFAARDMYFMINMWEESLMLQAQSVGDFMRAQRAVSVPSNDALWLKSLQVHDYKEAQSVSEFENRPFMSELLGLAGWDMTPSTLFRAVNGASTWGANHYVLHGIYLNQDLTEIPFPPDMYKTNPYFRNLNIWADYSARIAYVNRNTTYQTDVLLYNPQSSIWALSGKYFRTKDEQDAWDDETQNVVWDSKALDINQTYTDIINSLADNHIQYLVADQHYMNKATIVEEAENTFEILNHQFDAIVLPPMEIISRQVAGKILQLAQSGVFIFSTGSLPKGSPEIGAIDEKVISLMDELTQETTWIDLRHSGSLKADLASAICDNITPQISIKYSSGKTLLAPRRFKENSFYWIANEEDSLLTCTLSLKEGEGRAFIWDPLTGSKTPVFYRKEAGRNLIDLELDPYRGFWLVFDSKEGMLVNPGNPSQLVKEQELLGPWKISVPTDTNLWLSTANVKLSKAPTPLALKTDPNNWQLNNVLGPIRATSHWKGKAFALESDTVYLRYKFLLDYFVKDAQLSIASMDWHELWINEQKVPETLYQREWTRCQDYKVDTFLRKGTNIIAIKVYNSDWPGIFALQAELSNPSGYNKNLQVGPSWKKSLDAGPGWEKATFDDSHWVIPALAPDYYQTLLEYIQPPLAVDSFAFIWWQIDLPPSSSKLTLPGITHLSFAFEHDNQVRTIKGNTISIPENASRILLRWDPHQFSELSQPMQVFCKADNALTADKPLNFLDMGLIRYTGYIDYEHEFTIDTIYDSLNIELPDLEHVSEIFINSVPIGRFLNKGVIASIPTEILNTGKNILTVRLGNLILNHLCLLNDIKSSDNWSIGAAIREKSFYDAGFSPPIIRHFRN